MTKLQPIVSWGWMPDFQKESKVMIAHRFKETFRQRACLYLARSWVFGRSHWEPIMRHDTSFVSKTNLIIRGN